MTNLKKAKPDDYLKADDFVKEYPHLFTRGQLRHIMNCRRHNGFESAVRRINYHILLIHVPSAIEWIENKRGE